MADPKDLSDMFNTQLPPDQESAYQKWSKENGKAGDSYDYDMRGYFKTKDTFGYPVREKLFDGEDRFFRENKHVGGMAAEDGQVILNPHSPLSQQERAAVARNEGARLFMRDRKITPNFEVTEEQRRSFAGSAYADNPEAMRQTLAARIISGDPSARATPEQIAASDRIFNDARGHFPDTYKKPNHPTFSNQSQYNGQDGMYGGTWGKEGEQHTFTPGPANTHWRPLSRLQEYFKNEEPEAILYPPRQPLS